MTAAEFMRVVVEGPVKKKFKVRTEEGGDWKDIEPDEEMPPRIYGFAIYCERIVAKHILAINVMKDGKEKT